MADKPLPQRSLSRRELLSYSGAAAATTLVPGLGVPPVGADAHNGADLIVTDANILTLDPARPRAQALAVKNGLIQAVGSNSDILALKGRRSEVLSAAGKTVIPGLNDSHMHPTRAGRFYALELRWDGVDSLERGLGMIREQAGRTPRDQWVRVIGGWSPYQFAERRMPTPEELTRAAPGTPVYVLYLYSQGFLNKAAVERLGLGPHTLTPPGTAYEFTADGGAIIHARPNPDLLYGTIGALPSMSAAEQATSTKHFYRELNRFGLTSVIDAGGGGHKFPLDYKGSDILAETGELSVRISKYLFPQNKGRELAEFQQWTRQWQVGINRAQSIMNAYVLQGGGEFLVWSAGDYENFLADRPDITTREGWRPQLLAVTRHLLENRWPLRIHATYDQSINHILNVFEDAHAREVAAGRRGFAGIRWAIDHGETLQRPTLQRIKALGGGMAMQARMAYAGEYFLNRYGKNITRNTPPLRDVIEAGLPLGLGSDATRVASYNPWLTLYWATTGKSVGGTALHGRKQRLTREEALFHHTVGSAWFSQEEVLKGRLKPGQFADFAILNAPYLEVADEDLRHIESELTVMNGKSVYGAGKFADLISPPDPIQPQWSPVRTYGGYQSGGLS
ncbi:amidohydrolase [Exilibacterium tricleocarpae]|uniref:Amidohydrolase n=1 Tax=Exilibacterium tricleocarpae TaxID=2591008 RepID=A0A545UBE7_9GAMM|nr:amidohydrolase [Exilibacterium tricleocarpae]TQV86788.1 amidohydrolase [Exilibacterium tricleocarpae]